MIPAFGVGDLGADIAKWNETRNNLVNKKTDPEQFKKFAKTTCEHIDQLLEVDIHDLATTRKAVATLGELKTVIEKTQSKISELNFGQNDLNPSVKETLAKVDHVLLQLGYKQHKLTIKEDDKKEAKAKSIKGKFKSLMTKKAAGASTAVSVQGVKNTTPKGPDRPYKTFWIDFPRKALDDARSLAVGNEQHDTSANQNMGAPRLFARDVLGGFLFHLNGVLLSRTENKEQKAKEIYTAYSKAFGAEPKDPKEATHVDMAYLLTTLIDQAAFVAHAAQAHKLYPEGYPKAAGAPFVDVKIDGNNVKIILKNVMEIREGEEPYPAVMFKREITIPLKDFRESAGILAKFRPAIENLEQKAKTEQEQKAVQEYRDKMMENLFQELKSEDAYSSPIATKAVALSFLPSF